jgi:hypothetical protein
MKPFFVPPLEKDPERPFTATIVVEDHQNRRYELPRTTFRATPGPQQVQQVAGSEAPPEEPNGEINPEQPMPKTDT